MHRLGRTGREGKNGEGILLLAPWEEHFLDDIRDLPIERASAPHLDQDVKVKVVSLLREFLFVFVLRISINKDA